MVSQSDGQRFLEQLDKLESSFSDFIVQADDVDASMRSINKTMEETKDKAVDLDRAFTSGLKSALDSVVLGGGTLSGALGKIGQSLANATYHSAANQVSSQFGGMLASGAEKLLGAVMPFAKGGAISQGRVIPFAKGGVVDSPQYFPMNGATGLMGEAGPEAIMPLTRGGDGRLGVRADGAARPVNVVMNITTPDAESFRRSNSQIAAHMGRILGHAQRNR